MLHEWITTWFHWVEQWGYAGVFLLMAAESSIIPVPSEIVMPPAAYWAAQGRMSFFGVVLAGTLGSWAGSAASYWISQWAGLPLLRRYGKYVMVGPDKIELAERFVARYGLPGIFLARLLPVVRHLISIPAGVFRLPFGRFSAVTTAGAGIWCLVLAWFGRKVLGAHPELLQSPEDMIHALKSELRSFVLGALALAFLYAWVVAFKKRSVRTSTTG